jgi:uncharacterized protein
MRRLLLLPCFVVLGLDLSHGAEVLPPAPDHYFNDYAHVVRPATAQALDNELTQFERDTSNQIVVVIYPQLQTDSSLEDYTQRLIDRWGIGQKDKNNGAVLFVFIQDHKSRIATNYGLEGALPDAVCKRILDDEIAPRFRAGDYDGGLEAAVTAMLAATRGEYQGNGRTVNDRARRNGSGPNFPVVGIFIVLLILSSVLRSRRHVVYGSGGRGGFWGGGPWILPGGGFGGGGGGGWGGGGGGGGFTGGGGMGGGGGASGSW